MWEGPGGPGWAARPWTRVSPTAYRPPLRHQAALLPGPPLFSRELEPQKHLIRGVVLRMRRGPAERAGRCPGVQRRPETRGRDDGAHSEVMVLLPHHKPDTGKFLTCVGIANVFVKATSHLEDFPTCDSETMFLRRFLSNK